VNLSERLSAAGLDWIVPAWGAHARVRAFVTTRRGGVSGPSGDELDLGPSHLDRVDEPARSAVIENRRRAAAFLPAAPVWLEQVHGRAVATIDERNVDRNRGRPPVADAAVTRLFDAPLAIRVADCLPILFADDAGSVVAAAHAGWRGLAAGVLEATLEAMHVPPTAIVAWLGPGIGANAFEVGEDVHEAFVARDAGAGAHFVPRGRGAWLADLPALARRRLRAFGVTRIAGGDLCTHTDAKRFHSFRRDRTAARLAAFVWIERPAAGVARRAASPRASI
jgi:hypothetical protein